MQPGPAKVEGLLTYGPRRRNMTDGCTHCRINRKVAVIPDCREPASPEYTAALGIWIPGSRTSSAPQNDGAYRKLCGSMSVSSLRLPFARGTTASHSRR